MLAVKEDVRMKHAIRILMLCLGLTGAMSTLCQNTSEDAATGRKPELVKGKALYIAKPVYPSDPRARGMSGKVLVRLTIDEKGVVIMAEPLTGDEIFHAAAVAAGMQCKFTPTTLDGKPTKVTASITFTFARFDDWERVGVALGTLLSGHAAKTYPTKQLDFNWQGFEVERAEYDDLLKNESIAGKSERTKSLVNAISDKLERWNPRELWYFRLGLVTSRVDEAASDDELTEDFAPALKALGSLLDEAPTEIPLDRLQKLKQIVTNVLARKNLTRADRKAVVTALVESYNQKLSSM
jgi:TonB family protein